jgi:hypothetical protein
MLPLNRLREYQAEVCATLLDENGQRMFNYANMVVDDSELSKFLGERVPEENTYLIAVVPSFRVKGQEDNAKWDNVLLFFILDKTDYSEHDHDSYLDIFVQTQKKAQAFIDKLIEDKQNNESLFCGFLNWLQEDSISIDPVWKKQGCNGWMIEINLETAL